MERSENFTGILEGVISGFGGHLLVDGRVHCSGYSVCTPGSRQSDVVEKVKRTAV